LENPLEELIQASGAHSTLYSVQVLTSSKPPFAKRLWEKESTGERRNNISSNKGIASNEETK
jgi:hypothetical protein